MSPDPPFDVPISGAVAAAVRRLHALAVRDGRRDEFLSAFRTITARPRAAADTAGEELYDLPRLGQTVRVVIVLPLSVVYGVHHGQRLVTISSVRYARPR